MWYFEVYYGAYRSRDVERNLVSVKGFISAIELLGFDEEAAERVGGWMFETFLLDALL